MWWDQNLEHHTKCAKVIVALGWFESEKPRLGCQNMLSRVKELSATSCKYMWWDLPKHLFVRAAYMF